ncbi:MAG: methionine gamma-lyase family protein [Christensenellaceae bacterium]|nr:methionine gamma-lyase family protein [Christensenellaceae bacterium]
MQQATRVEQRILEAESALEGVFRRIDQTEQICFGRVLDAFHQCRVAARHFAPSSGYGYGDEGRETLEKLFATALFAEDALVRPSIASGTHALAISLFGLLRPGDTLLCASGKPYDTLESVIGIGGAGKGQGSLAEYGVSYAQIGLKADGGIDLNALRAALEQKPSIRTVALQRSRGYAWRPSLSLAEIGQAAQIVHEKDPRIVVLVDNCYGEFVEAEEPTRVGADLIAGSLIKNPGGGLAPTGGYIAGRADLVEKCAYRLTSPGIGREVGSYQAGYGPFYQGLFQAPHTVAQALKGAALFGMAFEALGYAVSPRPGEPRGDIIQAVEFGSAKKLIAFCQAIQAASPVDSFAVPEPWAMPGYQNEVIMAAGSFVAGASIELSADAPLREPYIGYLQGALSYAHARQALKTVLLRLGVDEQ